MRQAKVYVKFPKAGLGNMMLTWSRAFVFSKLNNLELHTSPWTGFHHGAWIRRERKKRFYFGYFKESNLFKKIRFLFYLETRKKIIEPPVQRLSAPGNNDLFVFNKIFIDYDFFKEIRPYKELVKKGIFNMLQPRLQKQYLQYNKPVIGLHIRRGDFKIGSTLTPLSFFIEVVSEIRRQAKKDLPVTIFTDADKSELKELTDLPFVEIAEEKADILDILLLASSKIVVLSIGSTFSYWAAFLSEGVVIKHPKEWHVSFSQGNCDREFNWNNELFYNSIGIKEKLNNIFRDF